MIFNGHAFVKGFDCRQLSCSGGGSVIPDIFEKIHVVVDLFRRNSGKKTVVNRRSIKLLHAFVVGRESVPL